MAFQALELSETWRRVEFAPSVDDLARAAARGPYRPPGQRAGDQWGPPIEDRDPELELDGHDIPTRLAPGESRRVFVRVRRCPGRGVREELPVLRPSAGNSIAWQETATDPQTAIPPIIAGAS